MDRTADLRARVASSRQAQGLPATVEDPAALNYLASVFNGGPLHEPPTEEQINAGQARAQRLKEDKAERRAAVLAKERAWLYARWEKDAIPGQIDLLKAVAETWRP